MVEIRARGARSSVVGWHLDLGVFRGHPIGSASRSSSRPVGTFPSKEKR